MNANGDKEITTTYTTYTTFEEEVVSASGKSVGGKATSSTNTAGKLVVPQAQTVAALPKLSATAAAGPIDAPKLPTSSVQSGTQAVPAPALTKATTVQTVTNTASSNKQGEL